MTAEVRRDPKARGPLPTPARISPLPNLPVFHVLEGRKAVVAGGSEGALWKAELLSAAGARVLVLAGRDAKHFDGLAARPIRGQVTVLERPWREADLDGAALAVADFLDRTEASRFVRAAQAVGAPVNIVDQPELCDFQFGTIVNRAPLVLAISTAGGAPMLGQSIRARIESVLPLGLSAWARAAQAWRPRLKQRLGNFAGRRGFWERFVDTVWENPDRAPEEEDFEKLIGALPQERSGSVVLVGAGPGDPELLTLKAVRALQNATVILYDDLVGGAVLELARREATRIAVGKAGDGPSCSQAEISRRIVELARAGETVVRLKGGDPLIFGRATEEIDACRAAGIEVSVIPGISAAQGAAASLGFSLTERKEARRVQFVTGRGADGKLPSDIDWGAMADRRATTVLYMPKGTLNQFVRHGLAKGLDPATPAVAVASATRGDERHVAAQVSDIAGLVGELPAGAPVTVIIGWVARDLVRAPASLIPFRKAAAS